MPLLELVELVVELVVVEEEVLDVLVPDDELDEELDIIPPPDVLLELLVAMPPMPPAPPAADEEDPPPAPPVPGGTTSITPTSKHPVAAVVAATATIGPQTSQGKTRARMARRLHGSSARCNAKTRPDERYFAVLRLIVTTLSTEAGAGVSATDTFIRGLARKRLTTSVKPQPSSLRICTEP